MRRRLWLFVIALPVALLLLDALAWHFAVRYLEAGLADWTVQAQAAGWKLESGKPEPGGWPLAAHLTLRNVHLTGGAADVPRGVDWQCDALTFGIDLRHPRDVTVTVPGPQNLRVGESPPVPLSARVLSARLPLQQNPNAIRLSAENMLIGPAPDRPERLSVNHLSLRATLHPDAPQGQPTVTLALAVRGIGLPAEHDWPLGRQVGSLVLNAVVNGKLHSAPSLAERAAAWRDDGGNLEVQRLAVNWGPLDLSGTATLALDAQLQPMGAGTARAVGYAATLDALARHGVMTRSAATAAKAVLSLLASAPDDGSPGEVEVPLSLQYRTLSMRQVPLGRLPELDWPGH